MRVNAEYLERLNYLIGELLTNQNSQFLQDEQVQGAIQELFSQLRQHQQMLSKLRDWSDPMLMRSKPDSYSDLHDLVQSLQKNAVQLEAATDAIDLFSRQSSQTLEKQGRLLTSAHDNLLAARMVPSGDIFSRLPRVLQQLETLHNKPVAISADDSPRPRSLAPQLHAPSGSDLRVMPAETLLVVDDSLTLRQTLALTLQKSGYQVLQAGDGYEAIEQLRLQPAIRLVICDIEMQRMNGFEFLNYRLHDPTLAEIPVVILTSQSGEKQRLIAEELGASAYISKPYLEEQLLAIVADLLPKKY